MSHDGTVEGYAAYKVANNVNYHEAYMLGMYDVFINTAGARIAVANSMEVPNSAGVKVHHACNVRISNDNMGGFKSVINGEVQSTYYVNGAGKRFYLVDYVGTETPEPFERPVSSNAKEYFTEKNITVYPNPVKDILNIISENDIEKVTISDLNGRKLFQQNGNISQINMSAYQQGIYLLTVETTNSTKIKVAKK
jgi:hypothetical protein